MSGKYDALFDPESLRAIQEFYDTRERWQEILAYRKLADRIGHVRNLFYGDSITEAWPLHEHFPNHSLLNRGIGGDNVCGLYLRLAEDVFAYTPEKVFILIGINGIELPKADWARVGQGVENNYMGLKSGLLDQFSSIFGKKDSMILSDFRSVEVLRTVALPAGYSIVVVNSMAKHNLVDSEYNVRRQDCESAAHKLAGMYPDVRTLRDVSLEQLEVARPVLTEREYRRAPHVVGERTRVMEAGPYPGRPPIVGSFTTRSASLMLRKLGLSLYLACLGLDAGKGFLDTVMRPEGLLWVGVGFVLTLVPIVIVGLIALRTKKFDFGTICGILCGSMANPMALGYANDTLRGDTAAISYATVYPLGMFIRVIIAQVIVMFFVG